MSIEEEVEKFMLVGIGMGGGLVMKLIQEDVKELSAGIVYYGLPRLEEIDFGKIKIPVQIHYPKGS